MIGISKSQYKMLRKIQKQKSISASSLSENELEICQHLMEMECLKCRDFFGKRALPSEVEVSQKGEAQIYLFRSTFYKWWIPVVISILALIVSIAAPIFSALL